PVPGRAGGRCRPGRPRGTAPPAGRTSAVGSPPASAAGPPPGPPPGTTTTSAVVLGHDRLTTMDRSAASHVLGVAPDATDDDIRRAFRRLLLEHHPDRTGGDGDAARLLVDAYRTLQAEAPGPPETTTTNLLEPLLAGGSLELELPPDEAFLAVLDAAADLG